MENKLYPTKKKKTSSKCPNCGFQISIHSTFESALSGKFDNPNEGAWSANSFSPLRKADLLSDVCVPGAQAGITALLLFPVAWGAVVFIGFDWMWAFSVSAVVLAGTWIRGINRLEMERGESREFSYEPVDGLGQVEMQAGQPRPISLEVLSKDDDFKASMKIVDLPSGVTATKFVEFSRSILAGKSLARRDWVGQGKEFSRDQYDGLMSAMAACGLVISVAGKGKMLTVGGKRALSRMARAARINS